MKKTLSALLCALFFFSLTAPFSPVHAATKHILTVGDSITYGSCSGSEIGSVVQSRTYQGQLQKYVGTQYTISNCGVSGLSVLPDPVYLKRGDTALAYGAAANQRIKTALTTSPDIVLIMLGTNDSKKTVGSDVGVWDAPTGGEENFYQAYKKLIQSFLDMPSNPEVYVMLPPPTLEEGYLNRSSYRISNENLEKYIVPITENIAEELGVRTIDLRSAFPQPNNQVGKVKLSRLLMDCVHPNANGYALMAETIAKALGFNTDLSTQNNTQTNATTPATPSTPPEQNTNTTTPSTPQTGNATTPEATTYRITYDANGAKGTAPTDKNEYKTGETAKLKKATNLKKKSHVFSGWCTDPKGEGKLLKSQSSLTIENNDITLYAIWTPVYKIEFVSFPNEVFEETPETIQNIKTGRSVALPAEEDLLYDRNAYSFLGWALSKDGDLLKADSVKIQDKSLKVYAIFEEIVQETEEPQTESDPPTEPTEPLDDSSIPNAFPRFLNIPLVCLIGLAVLFVTSLPIFFICRKTKNSSKKDSSEE